MARPTQVTPLADSPVEPSRAPDRRHQPRHKINSLVYLDVERDNGGVLLDFSEGGMCISVANPLLKASTIHFSLRLEENWRVDGTGCVSWVSPSGRSAGVNFVDLPASSRQWILRELGQAKPDEEKEFAEIVLETPQAAAASEEPPIAPATTEPAVVICEPLPPALPTESVPEQTLIPANAQPPAPQPPIPIAAAPLEPSYLQQEPTPTANESCASVSAPETPLFFLLGPKQESEARPPLDAPARKQALQEPVQPNGAELKPVFQPALVPARTPHERDDGNRFLRDVLFTTAIAATLLAIGIVLIFFYTAGAGGSFRVAPGSGPVVLAPSVAEGTQAGSSRGEQRFPVEAIDSSGRRWIVMATGRMPIVSESPSVAAGQEFFSLASRASAGPAARTPDPALAGIPGATTDQSLWGWDFPEHPANSSAPDARATRRMGAGKPIIVEARVGRDGVVESVRLLGRPASPLAHSIEQAVHHWRYRPLHRRGRSVTFTTRITFDFLAWITEKR